MMTGENRKTSCLPAVFPIFNKAVVDLDLGIELGPVVLNTAASARAQAGTGAQGGSGRWEVIDTPAPRCLTTRVGSRPRIGWRRSRTMVCRG